MQRENEVTFPVPVPHRSARAPRSRRGLLTSYSRWLAVLLVLVLVPILVGARTRREPRTWLKCQFHCHTTLSDGVMTPEQVLAGYAALGYDVLAITDHDLWSTGGRYDEMLLIPGDEISEPDHHCVHLGTIGERNKVRILAHPAYTGLTTERFMELMQDYDAWEIYNAICEIMPDKNGQRLPDGLASSEAYRPYTNKPAIVSDDSHSISMMGRTTTWLFARKEEADILDAIRKGRIRMEVRPAE